jgi:Fe-S oxidoreductase
VLFCDEFTNYYDVSVGIDAFELLTKLGYEVIFMIMKKAEFSTEAIIEPSAILTFKNEYIHTTDDTASAEKLAKKLLDNRRIFKKNYWVKSDRNNFLRRSAK